MYIIAMLTMLIDHIGLLFYPDQDVFRIVGRVAMPIYAYCIVIGYYHTSNQFNYLKRLGILAVISQLPFFLALGIQTVNMVGTFLICLMVLIVSDYAKKRSRPGGRFSAFLNRLPSLRSWNESNIIATCVLIIGCYILELFPFDYGAYALLLVWIYRYYKNHYVVMLHLGLNGFYYLSNGWFDQMYSIIPTLVIIYAPYLYDFFNKIKVSRWVWRSFYPVHLMILYFLFNIIEQ